MSSPHGIPVDLLDRLIIIRTTTYGPAEMIQVWPFFHMWNLLKAPKWITKCLCIDLSVYLLGADFSHPCTSGGTDCRWREFGLPWRGCTTSIFKVCFTMNCYTIDGWYSTLLPWMLNINSYGFPRHAVQLLTPASIVARMNGRDSICKVLRSTYLSLHVLVYRLVKVHYFPVINSIISSSGSHFYSYKLGGSWGSEFSISGCEVFC